MKFRYSATRAVVCVVLLGLLVLAYLNVPTFFNFNTKSTSTNLILHTIDVGHGDCLVAELPDGKILMIDAGKSSKYLTVKNYLTKLGVTKIDWFVNTHPDDDHYGGLTDLMRDYVISTIYRPAFEEIEMTASKLNAYSSLVNKMYGETDDVRVPETGEKIGKVGVYTITFVRPSVSGSGKENANSIMMTLEYENKIFVLTGDATTESEPTFIATTQAIFNNLAGKYVILKVGHHSSKTSTGTAFTNFIFNGTDKDKRFAIISCSTQDNNPNGDTMNALAGYCNEANIFVTLYDGDIVVVATADSLVINGKQFDIGYAAIFLVIGVAIITLCFYNYATHKRRSNAVV